MGLLGGLFEKKNCDFCGEKIGLLGNRKLADGNMCKECAKGMSSWVTDRKKWTVAEMGEHLNYRRANREVLQNFRHSGSIGRDQYRLYIDDANKEWFVTQYTNYMDENPDVFSYAQVRGCEFEVKDTRREIYYRDANGRNASFEPREYDYDYDFYVTVYLDCPFTDSIRFKVNSRRVDDVDCIEYQELFADCEDMKRVFDNMAHSSATRSPLEIPRPYYVDPQTRDRLNWEKRERERFIRERRAEFERRARQGYNNGRR